MENFNNPPQDTLFFQFGKESFQNRLGFDLAVLFEHLLPKSVR